MTVQKDIDDTSAGLRYIAVEGPIGVGKTTLAVRLATSLKGRTMLEVPEDNPFLERFYRDPKVWALSTQLSFLLQRARQAVNLRQADLFSPLVVSDFLLAKDRIFAELTLETDELALYDQVFDRVIGDIVEPDLVIYLQAPVNILQERIRRRGIAYERNMPAEYLNGLAQAYTAFFYNYARAPLLIVNAADIDLAHNEADFQQLLSQVRLSPTGRRYFNPLPL